MERYYWEKLQKYFFDFWLIPMFKSWPNFVENFKISLFFDEFDERVLLGKPSKIQKIKNVTLLWKPSKIWWKISESHKFFQYFHRSVLLGNPSKIKYSFFVVLLGKPSKIWWKIQIATFVMKLMVLLCKHYIFSKLWKCVFIQFDQSPPLTLMLQNISLGHSTSSNWLSM
jgi:hypothetical protein